MMEALNEQFGTAAEFDEPKGGIFLWVKLPDNVDTMKLYQPALAAGVAINPGPEWSVDKAHSKSRMRLCFASPTPRRNPRRHRRAGRSLPPRIRRADAHRQCETRRSRVNRPPQRPAGRLSAAQLLLGAAPAATGGSGRRVQFSPPQIRPPITQPLISSAPDGSTAIFEL